MFDHINSCEAKPKTTSGGRGVLHMLFQQKLVHQFQTRIRMKAIPLVTRERMIYVVNLDLNYSPRLGQTVIAT